MSDMQQDPATRLANILEAENTALAAHDLAGAAAMLTAKEAAATALALWHKQTPRPPAPERAALARVQRLAEENRQHLAQALSVQGKVLALLASASRVAHAAQRPAYGPRRATRPEAAHGPSMGMSRRA